jgi:hypothetical protein
MANENIFREVDEQLRSERMRRMWAQFGPFVIGAAVLVVVAVAANEGWSWYQNSRAAEASDRLYAALETAEGGDVEAARQTLADVEAEGVNGYPTLARFRQAGLLAESGDIQGAIAAYDTLASTESNIQLRELAFIMAANLLVDTGTLDDVEARIVTIASGEGGMVNAARELLGLARYKAGDHAAAQAVFEDILSDPRASNVQLSRVSFYLAQMLAEGRVAADEVTLEPEAELPALEGELEPAAEPDAVPDDATAPEDAAAPAAD